MLDGPPPESDAEYAKAVRLRRLYRGPAAPGSHDGVTTSLVSKQTTSATRIESLARPVIPQVAVAQKLVSHPPISSSAKD
jgi:hypothetical protein